MDLEIELPTSYGTAKCTLTNYNYSDYFKLTKEQWVAISYSHVILVMTDCNRSNLQKAVKLVNLIKKYCCGNSIYILANKSDDYDTDMIT